ncbi:stage II sporulation protein M [Gammaproteobacteria bacterium]
MDKNRFRKNVGSLISDLFEINSNDMNNFYSYFIIFMEGVFSTLISVYICSFINISNQGLFSIFLVASTFVLRLSQILDNNTKNIIYSKKNIFNSNKNSITLVTVIFLGIFTGYIIVSIFINDGVINYFNFIINLTRKGMIGNRFGPFVATFSNNISVMLLFFLLSFIYRSFGMMLIIGWNACVWGITFSTIFIQNKDGNNINIFLSIIAVTPHLIIEAVSYITTALSAIFLSKAVIIYNFKEETFKSIIKSVIIMLCFSSFCLFISSLVESYYTTYLLG